MKSDKARPGEQWKYRASIIGALIAFVVSNYWSYSAGATSGNALLIDTMSRYRTFYEEVRAAPERACGADMQLQGLYLSQYRAMLPVFNGDIIPPYDNPCPSKTPPAPPISLKINACKSWSTWEAFLSDPNPTMSINIRTILRLNIR